MRFGKSTIFLLMATTAMVEAAPNDPHFLDTPKREIRQSVVPMPGYQLEAINARARVKVYKWCRQSGKDFTAALEATLHALSEGSPWFIISLTERQSLATFDKVKTHLRAFGVVLSDLDFVDEVHTYIDDNGQWRTVASKKVNLPGGGSVTALPGKDPDAIAGLTGNVIFTEFALFPANGVDHWRVVFPLITRGFRIIVISTPRGFATKFAELCRNASGKYFVSVVDIHREVADGVKLKDEDGKRISIEELRTLYSDETGWRREYLVQETDDQEALIAWRYLELAQADYDARRIMVEKLDHYQPKHENAFDEVPGDGGPCFLGWDVARAGHLSCVWVNQLEGDVFWLRLLINMHRMDFDYQAEVLNQGMRRVSRGAGDAGGLGMESCQRLEKNYPGQFEGVNFSTHKPALGSKIMQTYQDVRQRIPSRGFEDVVCDLHAIQQERKEGRLKLSEERNALEKRSHCDMAYANALALFCASDPVGKIEGFFGSDLVGGGARSAI